jgi:hypothetical protein
MSDSPKTTRSHSPLRKLRTRNIFLSWPYIAQPDRRQHLQRCPLGTAVADGELDEDVLGGCLGDSTNMSSLFGHDRHSGTL